MKFKAAVTDNAPPDLLDKLNGTEIAGALMHDVVIDCLHVAPSDLGPATHYVQRTDRLISLTGDIGVVVGLTMVSKVRTRSDEDFARALRVIDQLYSELILSVLPAGRRAQLFVAIALDGEIEAPPHMGVRQTNLLETEPKWLEHAAQG